MVVGLSAYFDLNSLHALWRFASTPTRGMISPPAAAGRSRAASEPLHPETPAPRGADRRQAAGKNLDDLKMGHLSGADHS